MTAPVTMPKGIKFVNERPPGYRWLHEIHKETEKAVQFRYYSIIIWLPKKAVVRVRKTQKFCAQNWAIETAKSHISTKEAY